MKDSRTIICGLGLMVGSLLISAPAPAATGVVSQREGRLVAQGFLGDGPAAPLVVDVHRMAQAGGRSLEVVLESGEVLRWERTPIPVDVDAESLACAGERIPPPDDVLEGQGPLQHFVAGDFHAFAVRGDGSIVGWGCDDHGQITGMPPDLGPGGRAVVDLAAGVQHTVALLEDGSVACWGRNSRGQCDVPDEVAGVGDGSGVEVRLIGAGLDLSFALLSDDTLVYWGRFQGRYTPKVIPELAEGVIDVVWLQHDELEFSQSRGFQILFGDGVVLGESAKDPEDPIVEIAGGTTLSVRRSSGRVERNWGSLDGPYNFVPSPGVAGVPELLASQLVGGWNFIAALPAVDCDDDGVVDLEQIAVDPSIDCDRDGRLDACEDDPGLRLDCNGNGLADACEILAGDVADVDGDLVPDECRPDCDGDAIPDAHAVATGVVEDCDGDGVPDGCVGKKGDLNGNGRPDTCDVAFGDLDLDGCVGGGDLGRLLVDWGRIGDVPGNLTLPDWDYQGDVSGDAVDGADLGMLLIRWGQCP